MKTSWITKHITGAAKRPRWYRKYGKVIETDPGELIYQDNGGSILFVGHLDTVKWNKRPTIDESGIFDCPQLDDRLGVAMILERIGSIVDEPFDVLLCDCEEVGQSTAQFFRSSKQYRWICEFDRAGSDCVLYQYEGRTLQSSLEQCGFEIGIGSFSDISYLSQLGTQAMNFGCGYHCQHTPECYAYASEIESQLSKFAVWYQYHGEANYPYQPMPKHKSKHRKFDSWSWRDDYLISSPSCTITCTDCNFADNFADDDYCVNCGASLLLSLDDER